jgi:O-6-methylguanine DNA methyltransferase
VPLPPVILHTAVLDTALGEFRAHFSANGLARLDFPSREKSVAREELPAPFRHWAELTAAALRQMLDAQSVGKPVPLPPLDLSGGTKFRQRVWAELRRIPRGQSRSYGELAEALGKHRAARAVGGACGANPIPVLIPCHRVLAADGKLGGFSGGLDWKRRLLAIEGVLLT